MASFDVSSLSMNIAIAETCEIIMNVFFPESDNVYRDKYWRTYAT